MTGTWDRLSLTSNDLAGWRFQTITLDASGAATFDRCVASGGPCVVAGEVTYAIDSSGNVTASGTAANPSLHGSMDASRELIIASATSGAGYTIQVFRKRVAGVTWSSADVADLDFAFHELHSGAQAIRERGAGFAVAGEMTISSTATSSGGTPTLQVGAYDTMSVDADGLVTQATDVTFHGFMTADKAVVFGVRTAAPGEYALTVRVATGGSFTQGDLTGTWLLRTLTSGPTQATSTWLRSVASVDGAGGFTFSSSANPAGAVSIIGQTVAVQPDGSLTCTDQASYSGRMALGKALYVRTSTAASSQGSMSILVR